MRQNNPDSKLIDLLREDAPFVKSFCEHYKVELLDIRKTWERGYPEPEYSFSDNLGYYNIDGIKKSLEGDAD